MISIHLITILQLIRLLSNLKNKNIESSNIDFINI